MFQFDTCQAELLADIEAKKAKREEELAKKKQEAAFQSLLSALAQSCSQSWFAGQEQGQARPP